MLLCSCSSHDGVRSGAQVAPPYMEQEEAPLPEDAARDTDAVQAQKAVKNFLGKDRPLAVFPETNTLFFADRPLAARRVIQLLHSLDVNVLGEMGFEIMPLAAIPPQEAVDRLREIITGQGQLNKSRIGDSTVFIPLDRLPGVLVVSPYPEALQAVRGWLAALDVHTEAAGEQVFVYHLENGLASKIAPILQELFARQGQWQRRSGRAGVHRKKHQGGDG